MAIKIDLEKAYDRLKWSFTHDTLKEMCRPQNLIEAIMSCVLTCSMKVLWNGEPTKEFHPLRVI